uniref:DNA topoisomerase 2-binding protein 1 n=1 Tax=Rhabditophanes sp. KR3021 TaxID=114890 RepID=A0AC35TLT6_9BILA
MHDVKRCKFCSHYLKNVVIAFTGVFPKEKEVLKELIESFGGRFTNDMNGEVTYLFARECSPKSEKYARFCQLHQDKIILPEYIYSLRDNSENHDRPPIEESISQWICPLFNNMIFCASGISNENNKRMLEYEITKRGGKYTGTFKRSEITHLICRKAEGEKYRKAKTWGKVEVVSIEWFNNSVNKNRNEYYDNFPIAKDGEESSLLSKNPSYKVILSSPIHFSAKENAATRKGSTHIVFSQMTEPMRKNMGAVLNGSSNKMVVTEPEAFEFWTNLIEKRNDKRKVAPSICNNLPHLSQMSLDPDVEEVSEKVKAEEETEQTLLNFPTSIFEESDSSELECFESDNVKKSIANVKKSVASVKKLAANVKNTVHNGIKTVLSEVNSAIEMKIGDGMSGQSWYKFGGDFAAPKQAQCTESIAGFKEPKLQSTKRKSSSFISPIKKRERLNFVEDDLTRDRLQLINDSAKKAQKVPKNVINGILSVKTKDDEFNPFQTQPCLNPFND